MDYRIDINKLYHADTKFFYMSLEQMVVKKGFKKLDRLSVNAYMESQNDKVKSRYELYGGYDAIEEGMLLFDSFNIATYYKEVIRYDAIRKLMTGGFDVYKNREKLLTMDYEGLMAEMEGFFNNIFEESTVEDKVIDIREGVRDMVAKANEGVNKGFPVRSRMLNSVINGLALGNITMVAGMSGSFKTGVTMNQVLPTMVANKEKLLIMCNEEDVEKWQQDMLTWHINNIQSGDFSKSRFHEGLFTAQEKRWLENAMGWMDKHMEDDMIQFVNFNTFSMDKSIRLMKRKIVQEDIKFFIIDTLKLDNDIGSKVTDQAWLQLQQNMVKLYNVVKPSSYNRHVWVTYQLGKVQKRYLDQSTLGMSKNVADVVSTLILIRDVTQNEKKENGLKVRKRNKDGEYVDAKLNEDSNYMVLFVDKNRRGSTDDQMVFRVDKGKNIMKDVGFTKIAQDY